MAFSPAIAIVGTGAFGTALACVIARSTERPVMLLGRDREQVDAIRSTRRNDKALPGITLPQQVEASGDDAVLTSAPTILLAVPSQAQGEVARRIAGHVGPSATIVICAKGLERATNRFLSGVIGDALPGRPVSVLSGPGFAADIAKGLPTAMTIAARTSAEAEVVAAQLSGASFRLYASDDISGVEIGGALKNVLAIACGIVEGAGLGDSARAALIARGLAEMARFATAHGARTETVNGLSGLGDLVLTATSHQSRNLRYGIALGQGTLAAALDAPGAPLSEGAYTAAVAAAIAAERAIDMPITAAVAQIVAGRVSVAEAIAALMARPLRNESGAGA